MKIGFDLDGTLDRPIIAGLATALLSGGHEVFVVTGVFPEAIKWQDDDAKREKMERVGFDLYKEIGEFEVLTDSVTPKVPLLCILQAVPSTFPRDYRLADLGLRKGAFCDRHGIELFIDDSETYCEMVPKMSGATTVLQVR